MIEILSEMQNRIHTMRDGVLKEGSVMPEENYITASLDAKKKILWYLDLLAAAVVGAHWHMSAIEHDDFLSATDKEEIQQQIVKRLRQDLGWLPGTIRNLEYCVDEHAEEYEAGELQIHCETHARLDLLDQEVRDMFHALEADVT